MKFAFLLGAVVGSLAAQDKWCDVYNDRYYTGTPVNANKCIEGAKRCNYQDAKQKCNNQPDCIGITKDSSGNNARYTIHSNAELLEAGSTGVKMAYPKACDPSVARAATNNKNKQNNNDDGNDFGKLLFYSGQIDTTTGALLGLDSKDLLLGSALGNQDGGLGGENGLDMTTAMVMGMDPMQAMMITGGLNKPAVTKPVVTNPVVRNPVVRNPVVRSPVVRSPVVRSPVVRNPVVYSPVVHAGVHSANGIRCLHGIRTVYTTTGPKTVCNTAPLVQTAKPVVRKPAPLKKKQKKGKPCLGVKNIVACRKRVKARQNAKKARKFGN